MNIAKNQNPYTGFVRHLKQLELTCMTYRKIKFEGNFGKDYFYEIDRASERNGIQRELLETVLMLELINRKELVSNRKNRVFKRADFYRRV